MRITIMPKKKIVKDLQNWTWTFIAILLVIDIILFIIRVITPISTFTEIYMNLLIYSLTSALVFMIIIEFFKLKLLTLLNMVKYVKKPRFFEFGFFFFSFLATFFTIIGVGLFNTSDAFLDFLRSSWYFMSFYGIAFACGWYHYILRIDY